MLQKIATRTALMRSMVQSVPEQPAGQHPQTVQPPPRQRLEAALNAALSKKPSYAQSLTSQSQANSTIFQRALFACTLVCSVQKHQGSQAHSDHAHKARDQTLARAIECVCDPGPDKAQIRKDVNTALRIIPLSPTSDTGSMACLPTGTIRRHQTAPFEEELTAAVLRSLIRPAHSTAHSKTDVAEGTAAQASAVSSTSHLQDSVNEKPTSDLHLMDPLSELDANGTNSHDLNACRTWVHAAVTAMVPAGPGQQQAHAWWCTLCRSRSDSLPCILHMHCSLHAQNCAAALHITETIIRNVDKRAESEASKYDLGGVEVHAQKLLEAFLFFAWQELQKASMHEQNVVLNLLLGEGTSHAATECEAPLRALVSVFQASRRHTTELQAALAAVTNGLSLGESSEAATGVVSSMHQTVGYMKHESPIAAVVPALFPALAVAGSKAIFSHIWRLAASWHANAALWAELCCSTAANAGESCSATAAQTWTAAVRSAAAAQVFTVPAARNATVLCCAEVCKSSKSDLQQQKVHPELHEVLRNAVLHLLRRNNASDPSCILTALGCLQAASTAYKGYSSLLHSLSHKDCVDLVCAVCACSAGGWGWHCNAGNTAPAEVDLEVLQAQADASTVLQTLREVLYMVSTSAHASVDAQDILEASEAAARFHARYRLSRPPVGDAIVVRRPILTHASLCPQVDITVSTLVHMLGLQAHRSHCKHHSATLKMQSATDPQDPIAVTELQSNKAALRKAMKILYALNTELEESSGRCRSSIQEWYSTLTGEATAQSTTLLARDHDTLAARHDACDHGNSSGKAESNEAVNAVQTAPATDDQDDERCVPLPASCRPGKEVVNSVASFLALCAVPMSKQPVQKLPKGATRAPSPVHTACQQPSQEQELAGLLSKCLECTQQSDEPLTSVCSAAESPVATAAALTGTVAVLLPEFPAKRSEELLLALAAVRQRYLSPRTASGSHSASSAHHKTLQNFALLSGSASQAAAGVVALAQRAPAARACMCVLRSGHASRLPVHGWPQGWLELGEVSTGARAVGAALKVLCGVCMAAVKLMGTMHDPVRSRKHSLITGASQNEQESNVSVREAESIAPQLEATAAVLSRQIVSQGSIIRIFSETCSEVVSSSLAGHVDTAAAKQTLGKLLAELRKLLCNLVALLKGGDNRDGDSVAGKSSAMHATSYSVLVKHIVDNVVSCISKLPTELVDEGSCEGLQAWIEEELELDENVVVGAGEDAAIDVDSC